MSQNRPGTHLRKVAAAKGLPSVTWGKVWGYRKLDDAPEVWIGYERAFFETVHHRVENFIAGALGLPSLREAVRNTRTHLETRTVSYRSSTTTCGPRR
ncbi:hypothetical protein ACFQ6S_42070 [Streptomyces sp. NPDC056479]|uniref:hypothetical protein n=1 Tax=Streptomyces sp. NPDC056479 TaxID=3345832 RepID=UPI0036A51837